VTSPGPWVTFLRGDREYALDVREVLEILSHRPVTPLPGVRAGVAGVVSWRGQTLPVLDLPVPLKSGSPPPEGKKGLFVLCPDRPFALRVDAPGRILGGPGHAEEAVCEAAGGGVPGARWAQRIRWEDGWVPILDPREILGPRPLVAATVAAGEENA